MSNPTYLRRLYAPVRLLALLKLPCKTPQKKINDTLFHCVTLYDFCDRPWEVWVEARLHLAHACITQGWSQFCRHHGVRVNDCVLFKPGKVNGKQCIRVVVNRQTRREQSSA